MKKGTKVKFIVNNLGASREDDMWHTTEETYGVGDVGVVAFPHPNKKKLPNWFYVEVDSKECPGEKRYVGATANLVEVIE